MKIKKFIKKYGVFILLIAFIIVIVIIQRNFEKKKNTIIIENHNLYQYFEGVKFKYETKIKINKNTNKITKLTFKDVTVNLDSTPIYYADSKTALFPSNMIVSYPKLGSQNKINYYTKIYLDEDDDVYLEYENKKKKLVGTIIYDANNLYFFTEDVTVSYGNNKIDLSPLSYIIVDTLNNKINVYDYKNDNYKIYDNPDKLEVYITNDNLKVNASLDLMYYNEKSRLFIKKIEVLKNLKFD